MDKDPDTAEWTLWRARIAHLENALRDVHGCLDNLECDCVDPPEDRGEDPDNPATHAEYCSHYLQDLIVRYLAPSPLDPGQEEAPPKSSERIALEALAMRVDPETDIEAATAALQKIVGTALGRRAGSCPSWWTLRRYPWRVRPDPPPARRDNLLISPTLKEAATAAAGEVGLNAWVRRAIELRLEAKADDDKACGESVQ